MTIKDLQRLCHKIATEKGFWERTCKSCGNAVPESEKWCIGCDNLPEERNNGEIIALMHSELSEALEGLRKNNWKNVSEELADCVIRIMDFCEARGIDLEKEIKMKIEKNKKRKYRHGKRF